MAGPRDESSDAGGGSCGWGDGGSLFFEGERDLLGEAERLGGEEFGVISCKGVEIDAAAGVSEASLFATESGSMGSSSSRYIIDV